jgi:hypothetical protein
MRGHQPIRITKFNGLWKRGDDESVPLDHFSDCINVDFFDSGFESRKGIEPFIVDPPCGNLSNTKRTYRYPSPGGDTDRMLVLNSAGEIFDTGAPEPCTAILTIPEMTDFAAVFWNGRAYISPHDGIMGLEDEVVYVYLGYGEDARPAAGNGPTGAMTAANGSTTNVKLQAGQRVFAVVYETDTGFLTKIGGNVSHLCTGAHMVTLTNVPVSPDSFVVKRHIVATKAIPATEFTGDLNGYQFFFVPDGEIDDNVTTTLADIDFYDSELIDDATYLQDLLEEIPAGVNLTLYHSRLISIAEFGEADEDPLLDTSGNISLVRVSEPGELEAFDAVTGLFVAPLDGYPLTNAQEYRDNLYLFKNRKTISYVDNGDNPSTWLPVLIDSGMGATVHGIALVLDANGIHIDFLIICNITGVVLFNGGFGDNALSYKIEDFWDALDKDEFHEIQILNDPILRKLYIVTPDGNLLVGNYQQGLTPKDVKWTPWGFDLEVTTIALIDQNTLILGGLGEI